MRELIGALWGAAIMFLATFGASIFFTAFSPWSGPFGDPRRITFDLLLFKQDLLHLFLSAVAGGVLAVWFARSKPRILEAAFIGAACGVLVIPFWAFSRGISDGESIGNMLGLMMLATVLLGMQVALFWFLGAIILCFILGINKWTRKSPAK